MRNITIDAIAMATGTNCPPYVPLVPL